MSNGMAGAASAPNLFNVGWPGPESLDRRSAISVKAVMTLLADAERGAILPRPKQPPRPGCFLSKWRSVFLARGLTHDAKQCGNRRFGALPQPADEVRDRSPDFPIAAVQSHDQVGHAPTSDRRRLDLPSQRRQACFANGLVAVVLSDLDEQWNPGVEAAPAVGDGADGQLPGFGRFILQTRGEGLGRVDHRAGGGQGRDGRCRTLTSGSARSLVRAAITKGSSMGRRAQRWTRAPRCFYQVERVRRASAVFDRPGAAIDPRVIAAAIRTRGSWSFNKPTTHCRRFESVAARAGCDRLDAKLGERLGRRGADVGLFIPQQCGERAYRGRPVGETQSSQVLNRGDSVGGIPRPEGSERIGLIALLRDPDCDSATRRGRPR